MAHIRFLNILVLFCVLRMEVFDFVSEKKEKNQVT